MPRPEGHLPETQAADDASSTVLRELVRLLARQAARESIDAPAVALMPADQPDVD